MLIGVGRRRGGVYYFHSIEETLALAVGDVNKSDLWHARLGHPSPSVVRTISSTNKVIPYLHVQNKPCDACLRAKKTRDVFGINSARATSCFELIHCDVWGPYRFPSSCGARYFLTIVDDYS
ncbi:unnamed protein product, partial [Cuscuta europaea]